MTGRVFQTAHKKVQSKPATSSRGCNPPKQRSTDVGVSCSLLVPPETRPMVSVAVQWEAQESNDQAASETEEVDDFREDDDDSDDDPWYDPEEEHVHSEDDEVLDAQ